jgi:hypothetical protein
MAASPQLTLTSLCMVWFPLSCAIQEGFILQQRPPVMACKAAIFDMAQTKPQQTASRGQRAPFNA